MAATSPVKHTKEKPVPIVSNNAYWQLNSSEISENDMKEMEDILEDYCPGLYPVTDKTLVFISALSKKYQLPIIQFILSLYSKHVINWYSSDITHKQAFALQYFIDNCSFLQHYKVVDEKIYTSFVALIPILIKRLFCEPILNDIAYVILDDINEIIEIQRASQSLVCKNSMNDLPLRLDVCILPRNIKVTRDNDDIEQQADINIGDLSKVFAKYKDEGNSVYHHTIKYCKSIAWLPVLKEVVYEACRAFDIEHLMRYERYIIVIDRRERYCKQYIDIWFYEVDEDLNQTLPTKHYQYLSLLNLYYSKKFLFPTLRGKPIGLFAKSFNIFTISYCLNASDDISAYWIFNGAQLTFHPSIMKDIWRKLFEPDTISSENKQFVSNSVNVLCVTAAQTTCDSSGIKSQDTKPVMCAATDDGTKQDVDTSTLCEYIKQEIDVRYVAFVTQAIQRIEDEFDDIDDIKDDVDDVECSLILEDFEDQFQKELKKVIEKHIGRNT